MQAIDYFLGFFTSFFKKTWIIQELSTTFFQPILISKNCLQKLDKYVTLEQIQFVCWHCTRQVTSALKSEKKAKINIFNFFFFEYLTSPKRDLRTEEKKVPTYCTIFQFLEHLWNYKFQDCSNFTREKMKPPPRMSLEYKLWMQ